MSDDLTRVIADWRENGTPGPWLYRPHEYADWGDVYAGQFRICQARDPLRMDGRVLSEHRKNGTDPWGANAVFIAAAPAMADQIEALQAENARLRELLAECAADLEGELYAHYSPESLDHPAMRDRYERDIQPVRLARAALKDGEGQP